jgi:hypothetical protein
MSQSMQKKFTKHLKRRCTDFTKIEERPQNSRRQNDNKKQVPQWQPINIRRHRKKIYSPRRSDARVFCTPDSKDSSNFTIFTDVTPRSFVDRHQRSKGTSSIPNMKAVGTHLPNHTILTAVKNLRTKIHSSGTERASEPWQLINKCKNDCICMWSN